MGKVLNKTIICVDDDDGVLASYKSFLSPEINELDSVFEELFERGKSGSENDDNSLSYNLILASSGEQAVEIVKKKIDSGERIAAGFFDMRMPGGIDGYETIDLIRQFDPDIYCAVVTAYTDRNVDQIRTLFTENHCDELLYFQKPFTGFELKQTAFNMIHAWNRKRNVEKYIQVIESNRKGLQYILGAVRKLTVLPPHPLELLLSPILHQLMAMTEALGSCIIILNEEQQYHLGLATGSLDGKNKQIFEEDKILKKCLYEKKNFVENNTSYIALLFGQRILGALVIQCASPATADEVRRKLFEVYAVQISPIIMGSVFHNELVSKENEVITDPLTGLYNRRVIMRWFTSDLLRAEIGSYDLTIIMIDIDDFKKINDTFGHNSGDIVLKGIGDILDGVVRTCDVVRHSVERTVPHGGYAIRYGGEEFIVILTHTSSDGGEIAGERIRQSVAKKIFTDGDNEMKITVSLGISTVLVEPESHEKNIMDKVIANADSALYEAKNNGKNRLVVFS